MRVRFVSRNLQFLQGSNGQAQPCIAPVASHLLCTRTPLGMGFLRIKIFE